MLPCRSSRRKSLQDFPNNKFEGVTKSHEERLLWKPTVERIPSKSRYLLNNKGERRAETGTEVGNGQATRPIRGFNYEDIKFSSLQAAIQKPGHAGGPGEAQGQAGLGDRRPVQGNLPVHHLLHRQEGQPEREEGLPLHEGRGGNQQVQEHPSDKLGHRP
jgi:hypothetical protein